MSNDRWTIKEWQFVCHHNAVEHGFTWEKKDIDTVLLRIHSEASEAYEAFEARNFAHFGEELADVVIRLFDCAEFLEIDLGRLTDQKYMMDTDDGRFLKHVYIELLRLHLDITNAGEAVRHENQEKLEEYLAQILFDVQGICRLFSLDLEYHVRKKHEYNVQRPYLHGKPKRATTWKVRATSKRSRKKIEEVVTVKTVPAVKVQQLCGIKGPNGRKCKQPEGHSGSCTDGATIW